MSDIIQVNPLVFGGEGESVHANMLTTLWTNPDPSATFAPQDINLASSDYDFTYWDVLYSTSGYHLGYIVPKGTSVIFTFGGTTGSAYTTNAQRNVPYTNDTKYSAGTAYVQNSNGSRSADNTLLVPVAVYGFKKSLDITAIVSNVSTDATRCFMSDGVTSVETELGKKVEGWTLAGNVTSTSLVTVTVPATAKEILAVLVNPSNVILLSQVIPKALMSSGASLKDVANTAKELYYNGSKWKVTDATYTGKIYYR